MITCPSCNHQNPEGSLQCENCYTPLPATTSCPNCGASVQTDATFCGQCGFNLQAESARAELEETAIASPLPNSLEEVSANEIPLSEVNLDILPETTVSTPIQSPWDIDEIEQTQAQMQQLPDDFPELESTEVIDFSTLSETELVEVESSPSEEMAMSEKSESEKSESKKSESPFDLELEETTAQTLDSLDDLVIQRPEVDSAALKEDADIEVSLKESRYSLKDEASLATHKEVEKPETIAEYGIPIEEEVAFPEMEVPTKGTAIAATQLQVQTASLVHLQSNTTIEIPSDTNVVHIGKPNAQIPPDIDVAGFSNSEVVSRVHADLRIEGDAYYIEDVGSSNGTYINHSPLPEGNRHRLRTGDRIALGKGNLVTFVFQLNSTIQS